ncbi:Uma2 family endonuclease [Terrimonas pollutisoli]|uniref:Uma2 family endonuclease n=1 Tax=Terrimonas pollutisoli TaxID=3034147 RepID=UPI0023ED5824|nr:Uma2 family endonuclease [Terrimonas sp. H1YJ31]
MENEVKEPAPKYNYISPEQYLEMERASETKHEYYNGEIFTMAGASISHNEISFNINRLVAPSAHDKGCKLFGNDFRIYIPERSLFTYPDFSIVCGKADTSKLYSDNLTNPTVIIEILSKSTKDYDRGTKFFLYRSIKSLKEYILIDSRSVSVEIYTRQENNSWLLTEFNNLSDSFYMITIGLTLHLKEVYDDVSFEE